MFMPGARKCVCTLQRGFSSEQPSTDISAFQCDWVCEPPVSGSSLSGQKLLQRGLNLPFQGKIGKALGLLVVLRGAGVSWLGGLVKKLRLPVQGSELVALGTHPPPPPPPTPHAANI